MFKVMLNLCCTSPDNDGYFHRHLEMPFPPFVGLNLCWTEASLDGHTVTKVSWEADDAKFDCEVEEFSFDKPWADVLVLMRKWGWTWERDESPV